MIEAKNKRLHAAPERIYLFFPRNLANLKRLDAFLVISLRLSAYLTPAGPLLSLCSNFMCCSLS
jgi:hypothetical protein